MGGDKKGLEESMKSEEKRDDERRKWFEGKMDIRKGARMKEAQIHYNPKLFYTSCNILIIRVRSLSS